MKQSIGRRLLQLAGRYLEVKDLNPGNALAVDAETNRTYCWGLPTHRLRPGWYMLEVEHNANQTVGCALTLQVRYSDNKSDEYLLLSSKRLCKRIVFLPEHVSGLQLRVEASNPNLYKVSLVGLSARFAQARMQQRLTYHATKDTSDLEKTGLYPRYQAHFQKHCSRVEYIPRSPLITESVQGAPLERTLFLLAGDEDKDGFHSSLTLTIDRAVKLGVRIEWLSAHKGEVASGACELFERISQQVCSQRAFVMPIERHLRYRVDAIDTLLREASDTSVLVYADHDHVDKSDNYHHPVLKPEWNPELLLNTNYIEHPFILRCDWLLQHQVGEGSTIQATQLALVKAAFTLQHQQVVRIPQVLATVQTDDGFKPCSADWKQVVQQVINESEPEAIVGQGLLQSSARITWPLPKQAPTVDIIIPTKDKVGVLRTCIESVLGKTGYPNYQINVIDNDSSEADTFSYYDSLAMNHRVKIFHHSGGFNFSAINNAAIKQTEAEIVVLLNNDTEVINEGWLDELIRQAIRPGIGCVGAKLYYSNGMIQHGGVITGITGIAGHAHRYQDGDADGYCGRLKFSQNFSAVTAACLAVRRAVFEQLGGLDEQELGVAWNDVDFCLRVESAGYRNIWTPYAELYHHEGFSRGADDTKQKVLRARSEFAVMQQRWNLSSRVDPAYHPALTREHEDFSLAA
ncbi:MAG: glycosyltransferase [Granulosicoccus sp.]